MLEETILRRWQLCGISNHCGPSVNMHRATFRDTFAKPIAILARLARPGGLDGHVDPTSPAPCPVDFGFWKYVPLQSSMPSRFHSKRWPHEIYEQ